MMNKSVVSIEDLKVIFKGKQGFVDQYVLRKSRDVHAVDGLSLEIKEGEIFSLVGESGSGKTTTGRAILHLAPITEGKILFKDREVAAKDKRFMKTFRKEAQMIFQDPYQSLNPRFNVFEIVTEPLLFEEKKYSLSEKELMALRALEFAGLRPATEYLYRYPHELSGGQRQRVSIATCFVMKPDFIVADEPVSMLDASVRADILRLFVRMKKESGTAFLFITHDLSLAWLISDRVAIMYLGKIMEIGPADIISSGCQHPYSQALTSVLAIVGEKRRNEKILLEGETPSPIDIPSGCRFHPRCPIARERCSLEEPGYHEVKPGHLVHCHYPGNILKQKEKQDEKEN